nr:polysaccharide biosynthesis/export family protein [uncultured Mucilaginibacter sp.]
MLFKNAKVSSATNDSLPQTALAVKSTYRIQPRDVLQIRNLQNIKYIVDDLPSSTSGGGGGSVSQGQTFEVDEDGIVALPVIGHITVAGLTRVEATKKIEGLYRTELLKDPILELKVVNLKVTLFGEAAAQGNFPLVKDNTTLVELIGQAGGLTTNANEKNIKIIRGTGQQKTVVEVDLGDVNSISDPRTILQNGDIIYIAQNKRAIRNDKLQNLNTFIQPALILLNTALIFITLTKL